MMGDKLDILIFFLCFGWAMFFLFSIAKMGHDVSQKRYEQEQEFMKECLQYEKQYECTAKWMGM